MHRSLARSKSGRMRVIQPSVTRLFVLKKILLLDEGVGSWYANDDDDDDDADE